MPQQSPIAALVGAFGDAFAHTHNERIQQQIAVKARQDSAIAETLVKSGMENPELWQNENFTKAAKGVLGPQNAKAMAEVAAQFATSPMGILKKAFGAESITAPVSAGADGPGTGPSVPFAELPPSAQTAVGQARLGQSRSDAVGIGFGTGVGQLHAAQQKTDVSAGKVDLGQAKLDLAQKKAAQSQANADRTFTQKQSDVDRRKGEQQAKFALGRVEDRTIETLMGETLDYKVRVQPGADGSLTETPITGVKMAKPTGATLDKFQGLNTGIRAASQLTALLGESPEEMAKVLTPFLGDSIDNVLAKGGQLTPKQRKFVLLVKELRAQRSFANGGKNLTLNELQVFDGILPGLNESVQTLPVVIDHALQTLTQIGVDHENASHDVGVRSPATLVTPYNKKTIRELRRAMAKAPTAKKILQGPSGAAAASPDDDAVNSAFLQ